MSDPTHAPAAGNRLTGGKPTPAERGTSAAAPPAAAPPECAPASFPTGAKTPEAWAEYVIQYLTSGERPSYKVLLQIILIVRKAGGLAMFAKVLIERTHKEFGNHLNLLFIMIRADGTRELALTAAEIFAEQNVFVVPVGRTEGAPPPPGSPDAAGLNMILTYRGRALVQLGGEPFYVSGVAPWRARLPPGGTTSVFFVSRAANPNKMYRLDYDFLKEGPRFGQRGFEHNQEGVAKILKLGVTNHQPAGGWGRLAGRACQIFKFGGVPLFIYGVGKDVVSLYSALDRGRAAIQAAGRLAGGIPAGLVGAARGAKLGARAGPVGAGAGFLLGGLLFGWFGAMLGEAVADWGYCRLFIPLEAEEWEVFTESQVEPVTPPPGGSKATPQ